jgi:excinuclease ABC subunit A
VDLGPEGGDDGGRIIATGTPEQLAQIEGSHTGTFLKKILGKTVYPLPADRTLAGL